MRRLVVGLGVWLCVALLACGGEEPAPTMTEPPPAPPTDDVIGTWTPGVSLPEPLLEARAAVADGEIWVVGGIDAPRGSVDRTYRLAGGTSWQSGPALPARRDHLQLVAIADSLFALGGATSTPGTATDSPMYRTAREMWMLPPGGDSWLARPSLPERRAAGGAVALNGKIYAGGGFTSQILTIADWNNWQEFLLQTVVEYDAALGSWTTLDPMPTRRDHIAWAAADDGIYAISGRRLQIGETVSNTERLDTTTRTWTPGLAPIPAGRGGSVAVTLNGRIHVIGGEPAVYARRHDIYDPAANRWLTGTPLPAPVHGGAGVVLDSRIYIIGGAAGEASAEVQNAVWVFDPS